jgi:DNA polymerase eta
MSHQSSFTEAHHESEKASIDEAFIDFSRPVRAELVARYPYLGEVPADAPNGLDTVLPPPPPISWEGRGILIPVTPPSEDQAGSTGAHAEDDDDARRTWHDVALSIAAELMDKIRAEVRIQLKYTTSAVGFRGTVFGVSGDLTHPVTGDC